jgi:hypothetical protein
MGMTRPCRLFQSAESPTAFGQSEAVNDLNLRPAWC